MVTQTAGRDRWPAQIGGRILGYYDTADEALTRAWLQDATERDDLVEMASAQSRLDCAERAHHEPNRACRFCGTQS